MPVGTARVDKAIRRSVESIAIEADRGGSLKGAN